jgi:CheY-like chemotaxis protein
MGVRARPHVLVVDDHPEMANRVGEMVERAGFHTSVALGGREGITAFAAAQSAGSAFSMVITDFSMADLDGLAVAAAVKAASPSTPVVMLTAYAVNANDLLPRNVDAALTKPPSNAELRSTLERLIVAPDG